MCANIWLNKAFYFTIIPDNKVQLNFYSELNFLSAAIMMYLKKMTKFRFGHEKLHTLAWNQKI